MATIFPRNNKDGTTSWRVMIRRKGMKSFITAFVSEQDALDFVLEYEERYCLDPENFTYDHLLARRKREFAKRSKYNEH